MQPVDLGCLVQRIDPGSWQTLAFSERLLEMAGANEVRAFFTSRAWTGDLVTTIQLLWS
jgi:hypothetical protein